MNGRPAPIAVPSPSTVVGRCEREARADARASLVPSMAAALAVAASFVALTELGLRAASWWPVLASLATAGLTGLACYLRGTYVAPYLSIRRSLQPTPGPHTRENS